MKKCLKAAKKQGWTVYGKSNQHTTWVAPDGATIHGGLSVCNSTALAHRARLRRAGLKV